MAKKRNKSDKERKEEERKARLRARQEQRKAERKAKKQRQQAEISEELAVSQERERDIAQGSRRRSESFQKRLEREAEKDERRAIKERKLQERAEAGDPFAQSTLRSRARQADIAVKRGRKTAARTSIITGETEEELKERTTQEVAKEGFATGGKSGGRRAVAKLEKEREDKSQVQQQRSARFEKAKEQEKRKQEIRKKRFENEVNSIYQEYKDNPELTEKMMTEGTADLVDSYRNLKRKKLDKNQFTRALEDLRKEFNNTGQGKIEALEDRNGNLVIHSREDIQDPNNPINVISTPAEYVIDQATQTAMQRIGGEFRREALGRTRELEQLRAKAGVQEEAAIAREQRAEERGLEREQRAEERQIASEERRATTRQEQVEEERAFRGTQAELLAERKGIERVRKDFDRQLTASQREIDRINKEIAKGKNVAKLQNELEQAQAVNKRIRYKRILNDPALLNAQIESIMLKYPNVQRERVIEKLKELAR